MDLMMILKNHTWQFVIGSSIGVLGIIIAFVLYYKNPSIDIYELAEKLAKKSNDKQIQDKESEIRALKDTIKHLQEDSGNKLKQQALKALSNGDTEEAVKLLTKVAMANTKNASQDWVDVGDIVYLNNPKEALEAYNKAKAWLRITAT